jgi:hypothetical protein
MAVHTPDTHSAIHVTREAWLVAARDLLAAERFAPAGLRLWKTRVSVGFPVGRNRTQRIGECHYEAASRDGTRELFISPILDDPLTPQGVLATLTHELLHAALPVTVGHRGRFITGMRALGLTGKPTATSAGPELFTWFGSSLLPRLGIYPHAALQGPAPRVGQRNRHRKYVCPGCDQIIRAAGTGLHALCGGCQVAFELAD